jgi:hypothetical protein
MSALFPEKYKIVTGSPVATTNGGITGDYISVKNARRVIVIAELLQAQSHATALGYNVATAVAPTGAITGTPLMPIWKNAAILVSDTLVKSADAATIAATAGQTNQLLVMEIIPERLPAGYDCIAATLSDSSQATNFATITYLIEEKYPQATPPAAITD